MSLSIAAMKLFVSVSVGTHMLQRIEDVVRKIVQAVISIRVCDFNLKGIYWDFY